MSKPSVLFICVENSNRSQMAEAFARLHGGDRVDAHSAGSRPSGKVNPRAVQFMAERGYDLSTHTSKSLEPFNGIWTPTGLNSSRPGVACSPAPPSAARARRGGGAGGCGGPGSSAARGSCSPRSNTSR